MADEVGADIGVGIADARPYSGSGAKVDDLPDFMAAREIFELAGVGEVDLFEDEVGKFGANPVDPRLLERRVVMIVEIVDSDHLRPAREERPAGFRTDETGRPGDQDDHRQCIGGRNEVRKGRVRVFAAAVPDATDPRAQRLYANGPKQP